MNCLVLFVKVGKRRKKIMIKEDEFEKIIKTKPPFDKRNKKPKGDYGIGSLRFFFILKKGEKAVQVMISTNSYLSSVMKDYSKDGCLFEGDYEGYNCFDVGYHSDVPIFGAQNKSECNILEKGYCYYDGSSLRGINDKVAENYLKNGDEWVWNYLEGIWNEYFGDKK
jgi:hypothetical protein